MDKYSNNSGSIIARHCLVIVVVIVDGQEVPVIRISDDKIDRVHFVNFPDL